MSKKKVSFLSIIILFISFISYTILHNEEKEYINQILSKPEYSYLPQEAKEYIKDIYDKTGQIVLTEKNKEENTPYLNPQYVEYLTYSDEQKGEVDLIPNTYITDLIPNKNVENSNYPSTYNITNVDEKNYTTPTNNQGNLGVCWAFASIEQAESYLMVKNNNTYNDTTSRFSIRQMDYATSNNGINNYENENSFRTLTSGGNFYMSSLIMSYGLSLINNDSMPYNESVNKKELVDILNYKNSNYELNSTIIMPHISNDASVSTKNNYNNMVKENIIKYGGAYVGTGSPNGNCGFKNTDNTYAIVDADNCIGTSGHAMQIIGWDDNYSYSYCKQGSYHNEVNAHGSCSSGTLVSGTGAWILRNSWGENSDYKYVYLGYESYGLDINFTTGLSDMNTKTWDNVYHKNIWKDGTVNKTVDSIIFNKKINTQEKLEKIKFISLSDAGEYTVSIETKNNKYKNIKNINTDYAGISTVDLSDKNIILDDTQFKVIVESTNDTYLITNSISAFTSNTDSDPIIRTDNIQGDLITTNETNDYNIIAYSNTKNIESNESVSYSLYDGNINYSDFITKVYNNKVAENNINARLIINKNLPVGNYKLRISYGDYYSESDLMIPNVYKLEGEGTVDNPYKIYSESDLNQIRFDLDAYYLLEEDINLTKNWIPVGTYSNPFKGGFDGGNHTISGLKIEEDNDASVGLFGYMEVKYDYDITNVIPSIQYREKSYIRNLKLKNCNVSNNGNAGILIGQLTFDTNNPPDSASNIGDPSITIDNVHFIDGSVTSNIGDAGAIVGNVNIVPGHLNTPHLNINNSYSSVTISGLHSAGLIGYINDPYESGSWAMLQFSMSNIQNVGKIDASIEYSKYNNYSPVIGGVYGNARINLDNYIINSLFTDIGYMYEFTRSNDLYFIGYYDINTSKNLTYTNSHGYYISKYNYNNDFISSKDIKNETLYNSWESFNDYWKIEKINNISRIPVLKDIDYNYTDISDISIKINDEVSILNYFDTKSEFGYIEIDEISNDDVIDVEYTTSDDIYYDNIIIKGLKEGTAVLHVINNYDGLEKDISINVATNKVDNPIITYYSDGTTDAQYFTHTLKALQKFSLVENKFTKQGYTFVKWNTKPDGSGTSYSDKQIFENGIDENLNLYAQWTRTIYSIKFNANGGTGTMSDKSGYIDTDILLGSNLFAKKGYTFVEWNTEPDGTGLSFNNNGTINVGLLPAVENNTVILYAIWVQKNYTIIFDANGGTGTMSNYENITISNNDPIQIPSNKFTKENCKFIGWNTKPDGTGVSFVDNGLISSSTFLSRTGDTIMLFAIWGKNDAYTIKEYVYDETNHFINRITINTTNTDFEKNIILDSDYSLKVDYKTIYNKKVLYTGGKTKIYYGSMVYKEFTNIVSGDTNGDGKINYLDYVNVYNHIQKVKHPESNKNLLTSVYELAADMSDDNKINYMDYIRIYNKIKELKGGTN